ncbi:MAG: CHAT domain-containing protein [Melioribacteraceae bacterium]|nr:CHAT domain-containing protein [Melioribacteraceae bacterium]
MIKMKNVFITLSIFALAGILYQSCNVNKKEINPSSAEYMVSQADSLFKSAKYDSAIVVYENAAKRFQTQNKMSDYIYCLAGQGNSYRKKGEFNTAIIVLKRADSLASEILNNESPTRYRIYNEMGASYHYLGNFNKGRELLNKTLIGIDSTTISDNIKLGDELVQAYNLLAMFDFEEGYYEDALSKFKKAAHLRSIAESDAIPGLTDLFTNIAIVYHVKGDYEKALEIYSGNVERLINKYGENHPFVALNYQNMAVLLGDVIGDHERALSIYQRSLNILLKTLGENNMDVARVYYNMGLSYYHMGQLQNALAFHDKALSIYYDVLAKELHTDVSMSYHEMGRVYEALTDYPKAVSYYEQALSIRLKIFGKQHADVAQSYNSLGNINRSMHKYKEAIKYHNDALAILKNTYGTEHPAIAETYNNLAATYLEINSFDKAVESAQSAVTSNIPGFRSSNPYTIPPIDKALSELELLNTLARQAEIFFAKFQFSSGSRKDLEASLNNYSVLTELIDQIRKGYKAEGSKLLLAERTSRIFEKAIQASLKMYGISGDESYKEKAFLFAEQNKSEILSDALVEANAKYFSGIPDSLIQLEKNLKIDLAFYDTELQRELYETEETDSARVENFRERLFSLKDDYINLINRFETQYPEYYSLKYRRKSASINELQEALDDNSVVVEFFAGQKSLVTYIISGSEFHVLRQEIDSSFNNICETFYASIKKLDKTEYVESSQKLYDILIKPIEQYLKRNLVFIPDGILYYLPFEALIKGRDNNDNYTFASLDYLIKKHAVSYHYSAELYLSGMDDNSHKELKEKFVGFAPVFDDAEKLSGIKTSSAAVLQFGGSSDNLRSVFRNNNEFGSLPYSEREVEILVDLFDDKNLYAAGYFHEDADERTMKTQISDAKYLHIATHSFVNPIKPSLSGIILYPDDDSDSKEDGILYSGEIYNLDLNADLVVLSSCESGIGKLIKGEGMIALTRGFLYSGAKNIVTSLWKVFDESTSNLMINFYDAILSGKTYKESLRDAKLKMINDPATSFPLNWSGFVLIGE